MQKTNSNTFNNMKDIMYYTPKVFKILYNVNKRCLISMSILNIIVGFIPSITILTSQWLINSIQISSGKTIQFIMTPLITYIIINVLAELSVGQLNYLKANFKMELEYILQVKVLDKTKDLGMKEFEDPEIYNKLDRIDETSSEKLFNSYNNIFSLLTQIITITTSAMILASWEVWSVIPIIIISIVSSIYMLLIGEKQYKVQIERVAEHRKSWYFKYLLTKDTTYKEIKLYGLQNYFVSLYKDLNTKFINQDKKLLKLSYIITIIFSIMDHVIGGIICFLIIRASILGQILLGSTMSYIRCISTLQSSVQGFLGVIVNVYQEGLFVRHVFDFLELKSESKSESKNKKVIDEIKSIEFKNVSFKYPSRETLSLKNISFKFNKGDKVAIVGLNGSGKTTIVKLICGFYEEYNGSILINGIELSQINEESLRSNIAAIFQDYIKYELSLKENIYLGNIKNMDDTHLINSIVERVGGNHIKNSLPNSIDTQLGVWFDGGVQLSGGQWQKIAIMRALYRNASCYIFDEPNSALDPISESEVFESICEVTNGKIGFLVTHRMININKFASKIIMVDNGEVVECGTHIELMANKSKYYELYTKQFESSKYLNEMGIELA